MKDIKENVTLHFKGYSVECYSDDLGYHTLYAEDENKMEKILNILKERAKQINTDIEKTKIHVYKLYDLESNYIQCPNEEDLNCKNCVKIEHKIKDVYFSENSKKYKKLFGNKLKTYSLTCCQYSLDMYKDKVYKIDNKYYILEGEDLYEVPKSEYEFLENIIKKEN
jgi:hypothetical protein